MEEKKKEGRGKERRKNERKDGSGRGRGEERKERTLRERFSGFSARIPTRVRSNRDEEGRQLGAVGPKKGARDGHVSRTGHLPLKRTHCYVPIISFTLAANRVPSLPFAFFVFLSLAPRERV